MLFYHLVEFTGTSSVSIIPDNWLVGHSKCRWPNTPGDSSWVRRGKEPEESWATFRIKMLKSSANYNKMKRAEERSLDKTDIGSTDADSGMENPFNKIKRRRCTTQRWSPSKETRPRRSPTPPLSVSQESRPNSDSDSSDCAASPRSPTPPPVYIHCPSPPSHPDPVPISHSTPSHPRPTPSSRSTPNNNQFPVPPAPRVTPRPTATSSHHTASMSSMDQYIIKCMEDIKSEMRSVSRKLDRVLMGQETGRNQGCASVAVIPNDFQFPLKTIEELEALDGRLRQEEGMRQNLVRFLGTIGGVDARDALRRIMRKLISTPLALHYSMLGLKGKQSFSALKHVTLAIFDGVRQLFPGSTEAVMVKDVSNWLSTARDRDGGRQKRAETRTVAVDN